MTELSVVAPCYNEEGVILEFHRRMWAACEACDLHGYEIIFVDDGSSDSTWAQIETLSLADEHVVGVRLLRNHGHQLAITAGLAKASGQFVLLIDADLQDPPELLPKMLDEAFKGADVVYGRRTHRRGETKFKVLSAKIFYRFLALLADVRVPLDTGDFRLINKKVADVLKAMPEQQRFIRGMISWIGGRQVEIPYIREPRFAGTTKYPLGKMIKFAVDAVTSFSISPLRLATWLSFGGGIFSFLIMLYACLLWLTGQTIPGWTSIMATIGVFGSLQLLVLGLIGEYVGRLFIEQKGRPLFLIDRVVTSRDRHSTATEDGGGMLLNYPRQALEQAVEHGRSSS